MRQVAHLSMWENKKGYAGKCMCPCGKGHSSLRSAEGAFWQGNATKLKYEIAPNEPCLKLGKNILVKTVFHKICRLSSTIFKAVRKIVLILLTPKPDLC